jgi:hypothetical protein
VLHHNVTEVLYKNNNLILPLCIFHLVRMCSDNYYSQNDHCIWTTYYCTSNFRYSTISSSRGKHHSIRAVMVMMVMAVMKDVREVVPETS